MLALSFSSGELAGFHRGAGAARPSHKIAPTEAPPQAAADGHGQGAADSHSVLRMTLRSL